MTYDVTTDTEGATNLINVNKSFTSVDVSTKSFIKSQWIFCEWQCGNELTRLKSGFELNYYQKKDQKRQRKRLWLAFCNFQKKNDCRFHFLSEVFHSSIEAFIKELNISIMDKVYGENLVLTSGGSKGGSRNAPPGQILSISCSFWENLAKSYIGAPLESWRPTSGKSWIRHCWHSMQWFYFSLSLSKRWESPATRFGIKSS